MKTRIVKYLFATLIISIILSNTALSQFTIVKDINAIDIPIGGFPSNLIVVNGIMYLTANDGMHGIELWKSDGTSAGTKQVKDIRPGYFGGLDISGWLFKSGNSLLFNAYDGNQGGLWVSDGTESGTKLLIANLKLLGASSTAELNGIAYFVADDGIHGAELWRSNGTIAGTQIVKDIQTGLNSGGLQNLFLIDNTIYFSANDGINGTELWKTDGSESGTVIVKDIITGIGPSAPTNFEKFNGQLYFVIGNIYNRGQLWKSDGTSIGTVMVKDLYTGSGSIWIDELLSVNSVLFLKIYEPSNGQELWISDGTTSGTTILKDIKSGTIGSLPSHLTKVNNLLFFSANNGVNGVELWHSDGTSNGTIQTKDIYSGSNGSNPENFYSFGGELFFVANNGISGWDLYKSNGTLTGTTLVKDFSVGSNSYSPIYSLFVIYNNELFFASDDNINRGELWKTDGTETGTVRITDIYQVSQSSYPEQLTDINGTLYFSADDGINGKELWRSDGTITGTQMVKDIESGLPSSSPETMTLSNGTIFFKAKTELGFELWKSNGTSSGTLLVKDIYPGAESSSPAKLTELNGQVYFTANDGSNGTELWKSDGTGVGTKMVKDISTGPSSSNLYAFMQTKTRVYFVNELGLWKTDGSETGTSLVKSGIHVNEPQVEFIEYNDNLFFVGIYNGGDIELWRTDGTESGTYIVRDINPGSLSSNPEGLTIVNNKLYFRASNGTNGLELWVSDGTAAGTSMVKDICSGLCGSVPDEFTVANGTLYFSAYDQVNGNELWQSDGTVSGTKLLKDLWVGSNSSDPKHLTVLGNQIYFLARNTFSDVYYPFGDPYDLWTTDGSALGTVDLGKAFDSPIVAAGSTLFFIVTDVKSDKELWKYSIPRQNQSIAFNLLSSYEFGISPISLIGSSSSGLEVTYQSSNLSVAIIENKTLKIIGVGTTIVTASQSGNNLFNAANPVSVPITITKGSQTITFESIVAKQYGDPSFTLNATTTSNLPIVYTSSKPPVATISGSTITILNAGETNISANQDGNDYYLPSATKSQNLLINKAPQTILFNQLTEKNSNDQPFTISAIASSGLPIEFTSSNITVAEVAGTLVKIKSNGETNITASQSGNDNYLVASPVSQKLKINLVTGIVSPQNDILVYPNPGNQLYFVKLHEDGCAKLFKVIDQQGKTILEGELKVFDNQAALDLENISPGTYNLLINLCDSILLLRIIKQ